jgi:hypothetical protein
MTTVHQSRVRWLLSTLWLQHCRTIVEAIFIRLTLGAVELVASLGRQTRTTSPYGFNADHFLFDDRPGSNSL